MVGDIDGDVVGDMIGDVVGDIVGDGVQKLVPVSKSRESVKLVMRLRIVSVSSTLVMLMVIGRVNGEPV